MASKRDFGAIRKLPSGKWQARYRDQAGMMRSAESTFSTKTDAAKYLARVQTDQSGGVWTDPKLGRITFAAWSEQYLAGAVNKRVTTLAQDRARLRRHLLPFFGSMPLASITPLEVRRFVTALVDAGYRPSTVRTIYGCFRTIMASAVEAELLAVTPCRKVRALPARVPTEKRFLTVEEINRLAEHMPLQYQPMVYLAAVAGLRWSEVAGMRVGRLDLPRQNLRVAETAAQVGGFSEPKSKASRRTLSLPGFVVDMLAAHLARRGLTGADTDALLFVAPRGGRLYASPWHKRVWAPAVRAAKLDGLTFHGLRHTSVALMVAAHAHPKAIQNRLGHTSWATTMDLYGHVLPSTDDGVTVGLADLFAVAPAWHAEKGSTP